jgi:SnoaL-like protein
MKTLLARYGIAAVVVLVSSSPGWSQATLPELKKQPSPQAVLDEHLDALNHCDWNRLVAQYPDDAQIHLPGGMIVKGRKEIGDLFAGFCKDPKEGGLKGMTFKVEKSDKIGDVFVAQWVATAPFLVEPYKGSDAYITKDGYMQAMVSTFDGGALKMKK